MNDKTYELKWHWALERVSTDTYCVYDTDKRTTLAEASTPEEAIQNAHEKPLTEGQQKYAPKYAHSLIVQYEEVLRQYEEYLDFHPRATKLMVKRKPFIVIANDEPYFKAAYDQIKLKELDKGTWTEDDERCYQNLCVSSI